jgi:hypothetical protein
MCPSCEQGTLHRVDREGGVECRSCYSITPSGGLIIWGNRRLPERRQQIADWDAYLKAKHPAAHARDLYRRFRDPREDRDALLEGIDALRLGRRLAAQGSAV